MFDFTISSLIAGLVFGAFGLYVLKLGKQRANFYLLMSGIAMMVYPYFITNTILVWGVGIALCWFSYEIKDKY